MKIGITGTRKGMTGEQRSSFRTLLHLLKGLGFDQLVHGDCIGVDEQAFRMAKTKGLVTLACPAKVDKSLRAFTDSDFTREAEDPLTRNKNIVWFSDVMIACPKEAKEIRRSGTWATIRHTRTEQKKLYIIYPDGEVKEEN